MELPIEEEGEEQSPEVNPSAERFVFMSASTFSALKSASVSFYGVYLGTPTQVSEELVCVVHPFNDATCNALVALGMEVRVGAVDGPLWEG